MQPTSEPLRGQVLANPSDDHVRLAYADWLISQDDPRGELIKVQVELAQRINPARRKRFSEIEKRLFNTNSAAFTAAAQTTNMNGRLRRGFIDVIKGLASDFAAGGAALVAVEPIERATLSEATDETLDAMIAAGTLGRLRSLTLNGSITDRGIAAFAQSDQLASIRILRLSKNQIGDAGVAALVGSAHFAVRSLSLNDNRISNTGVASIAVSKAARSLKKLFIARNNIDSDGVAALLGSTQLHALRELGLSGNREIGEAGCRQFLDPTLSGRLAHLYLESMNCPAPLRTELKELWGNHIHL